MRARRSLLSVSLAALCAAAAAFAAGAARAQEVFISSQAIVGPGFAIGECASLPDFYTELNYDGTFAECSLSNGSATATWTCQDETAGCLSPGEGFQVTPNTTYTVSAVHEVFFACYTDDFGDCLGPVDPAGFSFVFESCTPSCSVFAPGDLFFPDAFGTEIGETSDSAVSTSISPTSATLGPGQKQQFTANHAVTWSPQPAAGSVDANGLYTAPAAIATAQNVTVTACNASNSLDCAEAQVSLVPVAISITENDVEVLPGLTHPFHATVTPSTVAQGVTWTFLSNPHDAGSLSSPTANPVTFTANPVPSSSTVLLQACSDFDTNQCATTTVFVPAVSIVLAAAANPFLAQAGALDPFTASVNGTTLNNAVNWSITAGAGTIAATGLDAAQYQAPTPAINQTAQPAITACLTATAALPPANQICSPPFTLTVVPPVFFALAPPAWASGQATAITLTGTGFGTDPQVIPSDPLVSFTETSLTPNATGGSVLAGSVNVPSMAAGEQLTLTLVDTTSPLVSAPQSSTTVTVLPVQLAATMLPPTFTMQEGQTQVFTPNITCKTASAVPCTIPTAVQCTVTPALGTLTSSSTCTYTATAGVATSTVVQGRACLAFSPLICGTFTITLTPTVVTVAPASASLTAGRTQQLSAAVSGNSVTSVVWSIAPAVGTISTGGLYTAPATVTSPQTITVSACSTVDHTRCGQASVNLVPLPVLAPAALSFGAQNVGTAGSPQTAVLTNNNSSPLAIASIVAAGDFIQTNGCGTSLAAGTSCNINVSFAPTAAGSRTGSLTVSHNAANSPQTVSLAGTGTVVSLSPASLAFGSQVVGTTSAPLTVTLTNSSAAPFAFTTAFASGDFAVSNNCPASLAVNASCSLTVSFVPINVGVRTAALTVSGGGPTSPVAVALSGTGLPLIPVLAGITPAVVTAGSSGFTLVATGASFARTAVVQVNGSARTTLYVDDPQLGMPTQLHATIPASDLAVTGSLAVTVLNPGSTGGQSAALTLTVTSTPIPLIGSLSPVRALAGGPPRTLTVSGSNFPADSVVTVNGVSHATTWVDPGQLTATLSSADIAASGALAIAVASPSTGTSNSAPLIVFRYGDVNSDNVINIVDLVTLANVLAGNVVLFDSTPADLNCDGAVTIVDQVTLANYLAGNVKTLPVGTGCPQ